MSDQVVFTKEEVETIKSALESRKYYDDIPNPCKEVCVALSLLDSTRPRPKVPLEMIYGIKTSKDTPIPEWEAAMTRYVNLCGFDVED